MKNLEDYLPRRPRKKTPAKISESPVLSPDTIDALEKAESLVKEARKTILEASYDIASSPEREKSARSGAEDEDALYIRDIVAARFHEANESARIFTRPSTRPLAERICRPIARPRRARRPGRPNEESTTSRLKSIHSNRDSRRSPGICINACQKGLKKSSLPQFAAEIPTKDTSEFPGPWRIGNQNVANSFGVQRGPRVDIRNELTTTNVEKVVISPRPRSSLPAQRNVKTYEFQHESCVEKIVDGTTSARDEARSTETPNGDDVEPRDSLGTAEKSRDPISVGLTLDPIRKSCGFAAAASQIQGSRSDLGENKSGRSIPAERLEGHADAVCTGFAKRAEHVSGRNEEENIDDKENERNTGNAEDFIDFLRRSGNFESDERNENLRRKVFGRLDTNDKINIFDRAVDQFLDEFGHDEHREIRAKIPASLERQREKFLPEKEADLNLIEAAARETDFLLEEEFRGGEYFYENWDPEEINLQAPNFRHFEKTLRKFDCTIDEVLRGTRGLDVIISQCNFEKGIVSRSGSANRDRPCNAGLFYSAPTRDTSDELESRSIDDPRKKASENREERGAKDTTTKGREELIGTREYFNEKYGASRYYTETRLEVAKKLPMEGESSGGRYDNQPRFSTPLNNDAKITRPVKSKADCKSTEFARFLIGIQRPRGLFEAREKSDPAIADFENRNEGKIVLNRNEFLPAPQRNDLEAPKKNVFDESSKRCNFESPADGDRSENERKTRVTQTFANCPTGEKAEFSEVRNSETRSLIQDSAFGPGTDRSDGISVGTKLIDECSAKKDSSRSEQCGPPERDSSESKRSTTKKDARASQFEAVDGKNIVSERTKTLTVKNNSQLSVEKAQNSEKKLSTALQSVDVGKTSNRENEHSVKNNASTSKKNRHSESPGSSLKDRTSFDVSTVYSEDFEELAASDEKSKAQEESGTSKSGGFKSIANSVGFATPIANRSETTAAKVEVEDNKEGDNETAVKSSLQSSVTEKLHEESRKKEAQYLDKSVSMSASKLSLKTEENKKNDSVGGREVELVVDEKGTVECNSETKEADEIRPEEQEKFGRDEDAASTSESAKVSGTSSIAGASRLQETNAAVTADTCSENYSEGELYLPSSCSYSLGEIRISERGFCGTVGPAVIQSSVARNADGMRIYFGGKASALGSSSNAIRASNSVPRSPGELQETDVESISSSRSATSEGEHRLLQPYTLQLRPTDT